MTAGCSARALHRHDVPVWVASLGRRTRRRSTAQVAALARAEGVREVAPDGPWPSLGLLVDAILGTGASGAPRAPAAALLERMLDLDLPVARHRRTDRTRPRHRRGRMASTRADVTVTFGGFRRGHLLARDEVGDVVVVDIGHPAADPACPLFVTDDVRGRAPAAAAMPPPTRAIRGRVVVIGGDAGMSGARAPRRPRGLRGGCRAGARGVAPEATIAAFARREPDLQTLAHPLVGAVGDGSARCSSAPMRS